MFDRIREDFNAHDRDPWRPGVWVLLVYRFGCWRYRVRPAILRKPLSLAYRFLKTGVQILSGIDLPCEATIGRRLIIDHFGGIIISGDAIIGDDVRLRHGVTLGLRRTLMPGSPKIGNRVDIGAGAKLLGPIVVGDDAVIGANAVVLCDVPPGSLAVGVPARIVGRRPSAGVKNDASEAQMDCSTLGADDDAPSSNRYPTP